MPLSGPLARLLVLAFAVARVAATQQPEALWYARGETSVESFLAHADRISIVSTQSFTLDRNGQIRGTIDPRIVATARRWGVKLVPLVMNPGFDQPAIHRVLTDRTVRARAIANLGRMCTAHHLDGIQSDIENVHVADKDAFTSFARDAAVVVHRAGCIEDARAFGAKLALVKKYGLRGYSVWKLGDEDPKTWEIVR